MNSDDHKTDSDNTQQLDRAIEAVKADAPISGDMAAAIERVRQQVKAQHARNAAGATTRWNSIDDYIAAIPDYLANRLSPSQKLLFEEESRQSISLRRALNQARQAQQTPAESVHKQRLPSLRWPAAAAAVVLVSIAAFFVAPELPSLDQTQIAQVDTINGKLYQVSEGRLTALAPGAWIDGRQNVRTANNSTAVLVLDDGSRVEVNGRSELSVTRRISGDRIDVDRGQIIVAASPQGSGTLDVATNEFVVSVKGTIFEVSHGAMGSRVGVIEGEVQVHQGRSHTSVTPGEQLGSRTGLATFGIENEIAWSQNADQYIALLQEIDALQRDLETAMATPPRYSTRLLDLAPQDTFVYIAVPNAPQKIAEVYQLFDDRMQQSERLAALWQDFATAENREELTDLMSWLGEIGGALGDETVFALSLETTPQQTQIAPVLLSEVDADAFTAALEKQLEKLHNANGGDAGQTDFNVVIVDNPEDAVNGQLSIWMHNDLLVASFDPAVLREMETAFTNGNSAFVGTELHTLLRDSYAQGAQFLGAVYLEKIFALDPSEPALKVTGLEHAQFLVAHYQQLDDRAVVKADLLFNDNRSGILSWLAEPSPMGSLDFFSTDTSFAAAAVFKDPLTIVTEMETLAHEFGEELRSNTGISQDNAPQHHEEAPFQLSVDLRNDVIATLGGEAAFGLDGPVLPTPSWKIVIEVYDELRLQQSIEQLAAELNRFLADREVADRGESVAVQITPAAVGNYNGYHVGFKVDGAAELANSGQTITDDVSAEDRQEVLKALSETSFNYAFVDGFLVIAPNTAVINNAISQYRSGLGLLTDAEFRSLLPADGYLDFSAVGFNRLGELVSDLLDNLPATLTPEQQSLVDSLEQRSSASLYSAYASPDRLRFNANTSAHFSFNVSQLLSLQSLLSGTDGEPSLLKMIDDRVNNNNP